MCFLELKNMIFPKSIIKKQIKDLYCLFIERRLNSRTQLNDLKELKCDNDFIVDVKEEDKSILHRFTKIFKDYVTENLDLKDDFFTGKDDSELFSIRAKLEKIKNEFNKLHKRCEQKIKDLDRKKEKEERESRKRKANDREISEDDIRITRLKKDGEIELSKTEACNVYYLGSKKPKLVDYESDYESDYEVEPKIPTSLYSSSSELQKGSEPQTSSLQTNV